MVDTQTYLIIVGAVLGIGAILYIGWAWYVTRQLPKHFLGGDE